MIPLILIRRVRASCRSTPVDFLRSQKGEAANQPRRRWASHRYRRKFSAPRRQRMKRDRHRWSCRFGWCLSGFALERQAEALRKFDHLDQDLSRKCSKAEGGPRAHGDGETYSESCPLSPAYLTLLLQRRGMELAKW